jgi:Fic family protein
MDLKHLNLFEFNGSTEALISDVDKLAQRVNEFRPLTPELVDSVHQKLFSERVYSSNAIEGNTLTLRETLEILTTGHISQRRRREGTEAKNLGAAVKHLEGVLLPEPHPHTADRLLELHAILLTDLEPTAGQFRNTRVMIAGAADQPPRPELIPPLVDQMFAVIAQSVDVSAVKVASWAHWAIARIHPFMDGNGRMARLWQDLVLLRARLAPAIIRLQDRDQNGYYDALAAADHGDLNSLTQLIAQRTAATLEQYVAAQQQATELVDWASKIAGETATRIAESRKAKYLRWARVMESLRNDFQRCAARITESGVEVQFREFPLIDEVAWENIRIGIGASQTWFFNLSFRHNGRSVRYTFYFGKHFWKVQDSDADRSEPRVALLISEQFLDGEAKPLYKLADCPILLREIFAVDTNLTGVYRSSGDDPENQATYVRDAVGLKMAQEFIEQVILRRLA